MKRQDLHDYQKFAIEKIENQERIALWLDCGLGKTIIVLTAISDLIAEGKIHKALIIAPKNIVENVWLQEKNNWEHVSHLNVKLILGTETQREKALNDDADVYVLSRDLVHWLFQKNDFHADMLILDESTSFKDRSTRRWASLMQKTITIGKKKIKRKSQLIAMFQRIVLLSGTPASESYQGLWGQIAILTAGRENPIEKTISAFREKYMQAQVFGNAIVYTKMKVGAIDEINQKLKDLCISMKAEDFLDLPDKIEIVRHTGMNDKNYFLMEKNGVIAVDGIDIITSNTLDKMNKLQQISSGFVYDENKNAHVLNHSKEEAVKEILEATDENVLIIYKFDFEKKILEKMGGIALDNQHAIDDWKAGKIKIGLIHPSCAYGLNIQGTCSMIVYYTLPFSLEQHEQSIKRIWRQGQKKKVRIFYMIGKGTIDEHVLNLLQQKKEVLNNLLNFFGRVSLWK